MDRVQVMRHNTLYDVLGPLDNGEDIDLWEDEGQAVRVSLVQQLTQEVTSRADALGCGQVIMPPGLLDEVTAQVLRLADQEPCGVRGGVLHVHYEGGADGGARVARVVMDASMPNTYELFLTLHPDTSSWYHRMARIIKPLRKAGPLLLSTHFTLEKKKLYPEE